MSFSFITIHGNLGKDPELRTLPSGRPVASFTICANDRRLIDGAMQKVQNWYTASVYGNSATAVAQNLRKGDPLYLQGTLKPDMWKGQNGDTRLTLKVDATVVNFVGRSRQNGEASAEAGATGAAAEAGEPGETEINDSEIPF
jgi:single-strand DNA-binding protein